MASLEELKREKEKLLIQIKAKEEILEIGRQRKALQREISSLKRPGRMKVRAGAKRVLIGAGKGTLKVLRNIAEAQRQEELREKQARARAMNKARARKKTRSPSKRKR